MFNLQILEDPSTAWAYLRRVVEASHPVVNSLLDTGLPVSEVAMAIAEANPRLPRELLEATQARRAVDPRPDMECASRRGWRLITRESPEWPESFGSAFVTQELNVHSLNSAVRGLRFAPFAVYVAGPGDLSTLARHSVTMVGTRAATRYGSEVAAEWSGQFAAHGLTIISGGAEGVDACAHHSALSRRSPTVAVMAGSLDRPYPKKHYELFRQIVDSGGALVSEYPPDTAPARHRFLTRNRLAAALGGATVVVEAALRSGALNTLNWANSMNKPTFAVPGPVTTVGSQGCLKAIQEQRAQLARTAAEIIEVLQGTQLSLELSGPSLSWEQTAIIDATLRPVEVEEIHRDTGLPMAIVVRQLRTLSSMGLVRRVGNQWQRV
ncbi:DNA-protecting protein DprA [Corynebacterium sp. 320]|uniref:DNA-processing protein DprA n=1 Tax=Corynebacterium TaxID=1716 RepID=UPI00125CCDF6|nr:MULTISPECIES: DNA-processing protein DprA [Corynebacterium]KAB1503820.1 DNA-protecting protein DprA [Corynebacterium sp. 320]KAB1553081.1 DNA-protecting protein DprA [Corynebacterium sp. 321]KAB1553701.1 DNA-protecting protein DprA [Corynebacterium sp. 319]KAB3527956.1 DNA-protecting protein DprA [Corynebacterium sp. 250]KAB3540556.1 DNA-protecting protein DprA [Corynebacterium sp. 366]